MKEAIVVLLVTAAVALAAIGIVGVHPTNACPMADPGPSGGGTHGGGGGAGGGPYLRGGGEYRGGGGYVGYDGRYRYPYYPYYYPVYPYPYYLYYGCQWIGNQYCCPVDGGWQCTY
jgi:hypothetical protein